MPPSWIIEPIDVLDYRPFSLASGFPSVAQVARRYTMNANLIHKWLKDPRFAPVVEEPDEVIDASFLPVEVAVSGVSADEAAPDPAPSALVRPALISRCQMGGGFLLRGQRR